jgi:TM2 domain-containing membrane protein YozV
MGISEISSSNIWKTQDRSLLIVACLTIFTGLLGLDHFYLRSFKTGFMKIAANLLLFGSWYIWDIAQLISDYKDVQENGYRIPMTTNSRIGEGVIANAVQVQQEQQPSQWNTPSVSIVLYALLAIIPITGFLGIDRLYAGSWTTAFSKVLFNIFLFGGWYFYDIYNVILHEEDIVKGGLINPPPFSGGRTSAGEFVPTPATDHPPQSLWQKLKRVVYSLLSLTDVASTLLSVAPSPIPQTVATAKEQIQNVVETVNGIVKVAEKGGKLLKKTTELGPEIMGAVTGQIGHTLQVITEEAAAGISSSKLAKGVNALSHIPQTGGSVAAGSIGASGAVVLAIMTILVTLGVYQGGKWLGTLAEETPVPAPDSESATIKIYHDGIVSPGKRT